MLESIDQYPFANNDFLFYFKNLWRDRPGKAIYQCLNRPHRRPYSRKMIHKFAPKGIGLEIGVGARTIAPVKRTVLSDAYNIHGVDDSIAKVFFRGDRIPYPDESFEFILSEHVLEHLTNPIKNIKEWIRVLRRNGKIFCFLPHKERTNDLYREVTPLSHLISDFEKDIPPSDDTHFNDWLHNVVLKNLLPEHYMHYSKKELLELGCIHHHVWTEKEIVELFTYLGLNIIYVDAKVYDRRDSFLVVAEKQ